MQNVNDKATASEADAAKEGALPRCRQVLEGDIGKTFMWLWMYEIYGLSCCGSNRWCFHHNPEHRGLGLEQFDSSFQSSGIYLSDQLGDSVRQQNIAQVNAPTKV